MSIDRLEVARGHDGFMRGAPEPVVVCGVFAITAAGPRLLGRGVAEFHRPKRSYPCTVEPHAADLIDAAAPRESGSLVLVSLAFEKDGGGDVQRAYAALERAADIALFDETAAEPAPIDLDDVAGDLAGWSTPRAVHLMVDGAHFVAADDDWVAGAAVAVERGGRRQRHRAHFASADGRNDWTASINVVA